MPEFQPPFCTNESCLSRAPDGIFLWHRAGFFARQADGRRVQRFRCRTCRQRFSTQSYRLDFRQQKPHVNRSLLSCLISKVTHRQTARVLHIDRKTVHRRLRCFGPALRDWHEVFLRRAQRRGGLRGSYSLDELETYEQDRRLQPVTVPVLIHRKTRFVIHLETAALAPRGNLSPSDQFRRDLRAAKCGPRRSGSRAAVRSCLEKLRAVHASGAMLELVTDQKSTYPVLAKEIFGNRIAAHVQESSRRARNTLNPMFAINHTLAMLRDHISRLVRRSWAASKLHDQLQVHAWCWIAWRNYVRPVTNDRPRVSAAMALGLAFRRYSGADLLRWRWPLLMPASSI
jgi:hypothetical protein